MQAGTPTYLVNAEVRVKLLLGEKDVAIATLQARVEELESALKAAQADKEPDNK
jgi:hypothetical protein